MNRKWNECRECNGLGGWTEPVLDYGQGPWYDCYYCKGEGTWTSWFWGAYLQYRYGGEFK